MNNRKLFPILRVVAFTTTVCFAWSLVLAAAVQAATYQLPLPLGHTRNLSRVEMAKIVGAVPMHSDPGEGGGAGGNAGSSPGATYSWIGSVGSVSTATGNKFTSIPTVKWVARGGMVVDLTLYHNSQVTLNSPSRGAKWALLYDADIKTDASGNAIVGWGTGNVYTFGKNMDGSYSAPPGIHETLTANGSPITSYDLVKKDQTRWHFASYTPGLFLSSITDENGNTITINRVANGGYASITDPSGRTVTFGYNSTYYTSITDPLNHTVNFGFDGNGNLSTVTYPVVNGNTYSLHLGYNGNHDLTSYQDLRGNISTYFYNSDDSVAWEKDSFGHQVTFEYGLDFYGSNNTLDTTIVDPNGYKTTHAYNGQGQLSYVYDALGNTEHYQYDANNNVLDKTDRRGFDWLYTYDGAGNVLTAADPYSHKTILTYNAHSRLLTIK